MLIKNLRSGGRRLPRFFSISSIRKDPSVTEAFVLYAFVALMSFNLLASFVYLLGFRQMRVLALRWFRSLATKAR